ncbi:MAG TPA: CoA-transferase [Syntrophomonadaceae bacterium]|nr:CoA-transferase [Syntrophomonadaceae bacterium]
MNSANKVMTMQEAISKYIHDGDCISFGGFVTNRKPYAAVREIIRQGIKDLYLEGGPGGGESDMLIGAGCVKVYLNSYIANSGFTQVCRRFRKAIEDGTILWEDYSLDVQPIMYHAAALGLPYVPVKNMLGSSMIDKWGIPEKVWKNDPKLASRKLIVTQNPFNPDEQVCLLPTPKIDTAVIHAQKASPDGTCRIDGILATDIDIAMGATNCIVTCEELVSNEEIRREPWLNQLPCLVPDAIVHAPFGAHPSQCPNYYDYDPAFFRMYDEVSRTDEAFKQFLDEWVYGVKDNDAYIDKLGARLTNLRVRPGYGYVPGVRGR